MRRSRPAESTEVSPLPWAEVERRSPFRRLVERRHVIVFWAAAPVGVLGIVTGNGHLALVPMTLATTAVLNGLVRKDTPRPPVPLRSPRPAGPLPKVALVKRSRLGEPHPERMFVAAKHSAAPDPWYHGGGIGLTRDGWITVGDGRTPVKSWGIRPGVTVPDRVDDDAPGASAHVAELAVIGYRGFMRRVYLRDAKAAAA